MPVLRRMHAQGQGVVGMKIPGVGSLAKDPAKMDKSIPITEPADKASPATQEAAKGAAP